jgi:methionyl-tRNA formyltransferase
MGTINLHGSLLPQYRGAAPINWAVINGEKETGVTTFKLKHEIDTGDILLQQSFSIDENDTAGDVHDKMKDIGAQLLVKTIKGIAEQTIQESPQTNSPFTIDHSLPKHAPKINTGTCRINWSQPVETVFNLVRGLSPYPAAFTIMNEKMLKIYNAKKEITAPTHTEGEYETDGKTFLKFACTNGYLHVLELQLEGKKKMGVEEFLRGYRFS